MEKQTIGTICPFVAPEERLKLIHFCARITQDSNVAEDLAQETLLVAWRDAHTLRDVHLLRPWLFGIARNICLRWLRLQKRDLGYLMQSYPGQGLLQIEMDDELADDFDVEVTLERKELIELLDRALSLLPKETQTVLIQRYVEESPLAEIASHLGTNASAVAMRLQRGKLALRRILRQELDQEMALSAEQASIDDWETTPLWCPICGQRRLLGQRNPREGKLFLKCPACNPGTDEMLNRSHVAILRGIRGYKPLYSRLAAWSDHYYHTGLRDGFIACDVCQRLISVSLRTPRQFPTWLRDQKEMLTWMSHPDERVVTILCDRCSFSSITSLESLALASAQGRQFLKMYPRIRTLPRRYLEINGCTAILIRFESVINTAGLDVILNDKTYEMLCISGGSSK
jgi:RNA polymerase sigma factor (sigma-70 family)